MDKAREISEPDNDGAVAIGFSEPYTVRVSVEGSCDMLFHRWDSDAVDVKSAAAKNSKAKKTDDLESYVYRMTDGNIALPGEYLRRSICEAAKFRADPRSPRKSSKDLFNAGVVVLTDLASLGTKKWDFEDRRRVLIQRNAITRTRPAFRIGWKASFDIMVILPEYIDRHALRETIEAAGRLIGVGDFRPKYGRFGIVSFK